MKSIRQILSFAVIVLVVFYFVECPSGSEDRNQGENNSASEQKADDSGVEQAEVDPVELAEFEAYLGRGPWICTEIMAGYAPEMRGASFQFSNGTMRISSALAIVENQYVIESVIPDYPEGAENSAIIRVNQNKEEDMMVWFEEGLMMLSWGGDSAKLKLER